MDWLGVRPYERGKEGEFQWGAQLTATPDLSELGAEHTAAKVKANGRCVRSPRA